MIWSLCTVYKYENVSNLKIHFLKAGIISADKEAGLTDKIYF